MHYNLWQPSKIPELPGNCHDFPDVCLQKSHLLEFLVLQLGEYQVLANYHNCQLTLDTFQWPKLMVTLCHLSYFFSLGVRFQVFLHLSLLKGVILGCIFMKLFIKHFIKYFIKHFGTLHSLFVFMESINILQEQKHEKHNEIEKKKIFLTWNGGYNPTDSL